MHLPYRWNVSVYRQRMYTALNVLCVFMKHIRKRCVVVKTTLVVRVLLFDSILYRFVFRLLLTLSIQ